MRVCLESASGCAIICDFVSRDCLFLTIWTDVEYTITERRETLTETLYSEYSGHRALQSGQCVAVQQSM